LLVLKLQGRANVSKESALLSAYRIWGDWFLAGVEFRPLKTLCENFRDHCWTAEDVTYVLTEAAGISDAQALMVAGLESGFFSLNSDGKSIGLAHFWRYNPHCSPNYQTIQQKGGHAAKAAERLVEMGKTAHERRLVLESQGALPFGDDVPPGAEQDKCLLLIDRMDRACGLRLRTSQDYLKGSLLRDALSVIRCTSDDQISLVEKYLIRERENPAVVKVPERILQNFSEIVLKAS